jgi:transglutaminase-like putative cysteine protease
VHDTERRLLLSPGEYVDSDHHAIQAFARRVTAGCSGPTEAVAAIYLAVRDGIRYDPYVDYTRPETFRASVVLRAEAG